jgi:hypothetical protein
MYPPLATGLAILVVLLLIALPSYRASQLVSRQLNGYWAGQDGSVLFAPTGNDHLMFQPAANAPETMIKSAFHLRWGTAARVAWSGCDDVAFTLRGEAFKIGNATVDGGHLELGAGRLTLHDSAGVSLVRFFRDPAAAAAAYEALANDGAEDDI